MPLKWNDIAAIRGMVHNGMTLKEIFNATDYNLHDIIKVIDDLKKELENGRNE